MITTESIHGPNEPDSTDRVFLTLEAANGAKARYSLFALNLKSVPDKLEHQGSTYKRGEGNVFTEQVDQPLAATDDEILQSEHPQPDGPAGGGGPMMPVAPKRKRK